MKYGEILSRAAHITFKHRSLWPFGIAIVLFSGASGLHGNGGSGLNYAFGSGDVQRLGSLGPWSWHQIGMILAAALAALTLLFIVLAIVGIIVRYTSTGALVSMVGEIETAGATGFRSGMRQGWKHLFRLFVTALVIGVVAFLAVLAFVVVLLCLAGIVIVPALPLLRAGHGWQVGGVLWIILAGAAWVGVVILGSIILSGVLTAVREYAYRAVVLGKAGSIEGIGQGWSLLKTHLKQTVWIWILLGFIQGAVQMVLLPVVLAVGGGSLVPAIALWRATGSALLPVLFGAPVLLLGGALLVAIGGVLETFRSTAWTLVYREFGAPPTP